MKTVYKFGRRWAVTDGGVFNTKEEAYASIANRSSDGSDSTGVVPESTDRELHGAAVDKAGGSPDSGDQCAEQSEISFCGSSPSETSW